MRCWFRNKLNRLKWEALGFFALLRNHHRSTSFQRRDLPVDMQHLRFQKRRAITSDDWTRLGRWDLQRSTLNAQRPMFNLRGMTERPGVMSKTVRALRVAPASADWFAH